MPRVVLADDLQAAREPADFPGDAIIVEVGTERGPARSHGVERQVELLELGGEGKQQEPIVTRSHQRIRTHISAMASSGIEGSQDEVQRSAGGVSTKTVWPPPNSTKKP